MQIEQNKSLKDFNTFAIDVKAKLYTELWHEDDIIQILKKYSSEKLLVLGGGSNILFTKDFDGLVIRNIIKGISVIYEDDDKVLLKAGAGVVWNDLVLFAIEQNYGGIENLIAIPGTAGAAPIQNIGAYGVELKDTFHSLKGIHIDTCSEEIFTSEQCRFGYRDSIFKRELKDKFIITYIILELSKNPVIKENYGSVADGLTKAGKTYPSIADVADVIKNIRESKLPDPALLGNAGSFFKNPVISSSLFNILINKYPEMPSFPAANGDYKIPAGWLIEKAGWKGKRLGNAGSHEKQSLVIVNYGGASSDDVIEVASQIKHTVKEKFGIELQEEVNII